MDFGAILSSLRRGEKIYRSGWHGKKMWLVLQNGYPQGIPMNENTATATGMEVGTIAKFDPYIMLHTAEDTFVPWVASQADILGRDWFVLH